MYLGSPGCDATAALQTLASDQSCPDAFLFKYDRETKQVRAKLGNTTRGLCMTAPKAPALPKPYVNISLQARAFYLPAPVLYNGVNCKHRLCGLDRHYAGTA